MAFAHQQGISAPALLIRAHEDDDAAHMPHSKIDGDQPAMACVHQQGISTPALFLISAHEDDVAAYKPATPRQCLCSPTTHEGSFRCRLHRSSQVKWPKVGLSPKASQSEDVGPPRNQWEKSLLTMPMPKLSMPSQRLRHAFSTPISEVIEAQ